MNAVDKTEIVCFDCGETHKANVLEDAGCVHAIAPMSWLTVSWTQENDLGRGAFTTAETIYFCETCKRSAFERFNGKNGKKTFFSNKLIEVRFGMPDGPSDFIASVEEMLDAFGKEFKKGYLEGTPEVRAGLRLSVKRLVEGLDAITREQTP